MVGRTCLVSEIFRQTAEKEGFSSTALLSWLKSKGLILTRGRNNARGKRINGVNAECVVMKLPDDNIDIEEEEVYYGDGVPF